MDEKIFSSLEMDAIGEILNISLGSSATAISTMLDRRVDITVPRVMVSNKEDFEFDYMQPAVGVEITYVSGLSGNNVMLLKRGDVKTIVDILIGTETADEDFEFNDISLSAICEVMNQMMGASSTALSEMMGESVNISTPTAFEINTAAEFAEKYLNHEGPMVVVRFSLKVENAIESEFLNVMTIDLTRKMLSCFGLGQEQSVEAVAPVATQTMAYESFPEPTQPEESSARMMSEEEIQKMLSGSAQAPVAPQAPVVAQPKVINVQPNVNPGAQGDLANAGREENLDLILGVPLEISVEIGRTKKNVREILEYNKGSLIVLDKLAGEQVDIYVNGQCIAKGDVVVVDDNFGVRVTEVLKKIK
ncbi:MAG: flagellar motor switch phosphatase FliY [Anaerotignum sp.]